MKKFLLNIILFFAIFFVLSIIFDICITKTLQKVTDYPLAKWNSVINKTQNAEVLILGNSRARGYNTDILSEILEKKCFNLGINAAAMIQQMRFYDIYTSFQDAPKYIIQNVDFITFKKNDEHLYQREMFFPYFANFEVRKKIFKIENYDLFEKYLPCYRYLGYFWMIRQAFGVDIQKENNIIAARHEIKFNEIPNLTGKIEFDENAIKTFNLFLKEMKKAGIKIILVHAPLYINTLNHINSMHILDSLSIENDVKFLNYAYDTISYNSNYFSNQTHLNKKGEELFTRKLAHDIDSLGILKRN